jgi:hypothetical protein
MAKYQESEYFSSKYGPYLRSGRQRLTFTNHTTNASTGFDQLIQPDLQKRIGTLFLLVKPQVPWSQLRSPGG